MDHAETPQERQGKAMLQPRANRAADDIEMQTQQQPEGKGTKKDEDDNAALCHLLALTCLFGLSEEQLHRWPGRTAYCRYLEGCFQQLLTDEYAFVWTAIGEQRPQIQMKCWPWFNSVCASIRRLREDSSIDDVWKTVRSSHTPKIPTTPMAALDNAAGIVAVFAILCWGSMTLHPNLDWAEFDESSGPCLMVQQQLSSDRERLNLDIVRRPIPAIFRTFQRTMPTTRWRQPINGTDHENSTILYVSTLNYASLKTIGKIRLEWVDNLSSHLDFDPKKRSLSIFRFPSFCALSALGDGGGPVFQALTQALYTADNENAAQIYQEVLMSYRLLFGQRSGSRVRARLALKELRTKDPYCYDQLLDVVCAQPFHSKVAELCPSLWPISCRSSDDILQEEDAYSSQDDFPMLGRRLEKLQAFSLRQQPSKLRDLWRDRRNPLQWYTFWAVLIVGSISILLGLLQLLVSIGQLAIAGRQSCNG